MKEVTITWNDKMVVRDEMFEEFERGHDAVGRASCDEKKS